MNLRAAVAAGVGVLLLGLATVVRASVVPTEIVEIPSSLDGTPQPARWMPAPEGEGPVPLLVWLHTWSADHTQRDPGDRAFEAAAARGWACIAPGFRGPNVGPDACASSLARRDVLDAVDWAGSPEQRIDPDRIYLAGSSGGGHMTLMMAGEAPGVWAAVAASVPVADLAAWHAFHSRGGHAGTYARHLERICGGAPSADRIESLDPARPIDAEYAARSPMSVLHRVGRLPIRIEAGIRDGHDGSVPIDHAIRAFNAVAIAGGALRDRIPSGEIDRLVAAPDDAAATLATAGNAWIAPTSDGGSSGPRDYPVLLSRQATGSGAELVLFDGAHDTDMPALLEFLARWTREPVRVTLPFHRGRTLVLGDSNAAAAGSWVASLRVLRPGWVIENRSLPGATVGFDNNGSRSLNTLATLGTIVGEIERSGPFDEVVIALGTNDAKADFDGREGEVNANLDTLLTRLRGPDGVRLGAPRITVALPPPVTGMTRIGDKYDGAPVRLAEFKETFARIAGDHGARVVDLHSLLSAEGRDAFTDGVHLTAKSHNLVARAIDAAMR